ncbi:hypothetical protein MTX38_22090 [Rhodococcus sp. ARC_M13]|uniref:hypothetical protein n=1 Tax=Rhodococcus sp. ARC_M13 TaxID=2928855 RepID=UPI001FB4E998|nr:hypothetical protein [Rhodococcus sp. ARC_M13]MCJ0899770.1 hypothetical protein [Rhodococcus sp. ARC_M13]
MSKNQNPDINFTYDDNGTLDGVLDYSEARTRAGNLALQLFDTGSDLGRMKKLLADERGPLPLQMWAEVSYQALGITQAFIVGALVEKLVAFGMSRGQVEDLVVAKIGDVVSEQRRSEGDVD